jgi:DNA helicase-2/ATP-dependent DNA helicase PcrA
MIEKGGDTGVTLSTVHRAKGLEWKRVLVFGADRGLLPHDLSLDVEEERRIFHVAITRGSERVAVFADDDLPSRFLAELTGEASRREEPEPLPPSPRKKVRAASGVSVERGERVAMSGGIRGSVIEIDEDGVWVGVEGGGEFQVRWGDAIDTATGKGPLAPTVGAITADPDLVERLKAWRLETARSKGVPAYVVLHDATIEVIAGVRPQNETQLASVPGIGPAKLEAYGDAIIDICAEPTA